MSGQVNVLQPLQVIHGEVQRFFAVAGLFGIGCTFSLVEKVGAVGFSHGVSSCAAISCQSQAVG
jgi:hypothetical protein